MSWIRLPLFFMISIPLRVRGDEHACIESLPCNKCGPFYQGTIFVVPCGNHKEDTTTLFTYFNEKGTLLLSNTTMFLRMNTTYKDNNTIIYCKVHDEEGSNCYLLNIQFPPTHDYKQSFRNPRFPAKGDKFTQKCPVIANPLPNCTWDFKKPYNKTVKTLPNLHFADNNCTMIVSAMTTAYIDVDYYCNAVNKYGNITEHLTAITILNCGSRSRQLTINGSSNYTTSVNVGSNVTFVCVATSIMNDWEMFWFHNNTYIFHGNGGYNKSQCTHTSVYELTDVTYNNSGNYSCKFHPYEVHAYLTVLPRPNSNPSLLQQNHIVWTSSLGSVLLSVIIVSIIIIIYCYLQKNRWKWKDPGPASYDLFLSYACEDEEIVETKIRQPLMEKGYNVFWHHRDFIGGVAIMDNIENAVENSRFTVTVLSNSFLQSDFCNKELRCALSKKRKTGTRCLIPVLLEEGCPIPKELKPFTYIKLFDSNFIDKLCKDIGNPCYYEAFSVITDSMALMDYRATVYPINA